MIGRAILFLIFGTFEGAALGAVSVRAFVSAAAGATLVPVREAATYWAIVGALHGLVLFLASLGETPVVADVRRGRFGASGVAGGFDYRRFGHRIPYVAGLFALAVAFGVAPLLAQSADTEVTSVGLRLVAGIGLCFVWTGFAMLVNIVIVSKIALS